MLLVPACGAAGGVLLPLDSAITPEHAMETFCESGAPLIVKTATVLAWTPVQFALLAISYATVVNPSPITGWTPTGPPD